MKGYLDVQRQYLIRWEGYGPEDDTWELRRNVYGGSRELVELYESQRESHYLFKSCLLAHSHSHLRQ